MAVPARAGGTRASQAAGRSKGKYPGPGWTIWGKLEAVLEKLERNRRWREVGRSHRFRTDNFWGMPGRKPGVANFHFGEKTWDRTWDARDT